MPRILWSPMNRPWEYNEPAPAYGEFYIEDVSGSDNVVTFIKTNTDAPTLSIQYSNDRETWSTLGDTTTEGITYTIQGTKKTYFRCKTTAWTISGLGYNYRNEIKVANSFNVGGDIMSLLYGDEFTGQETVFPTDSRYTFYHLFKDNTSLVDASDLILPAVTLVTECYDSLFYGCTSLIAPPALPATTLADSCYFDIFRRCSSLKTAPVLPARELTGNYCYYGMFNGCTSLTTPPELPATKLTGACYQAMFYGCTSLTTAPELPATTLAQSCYTSMFNGCTSLTTAPVLPASTLSSQCYWQMFYNCTSLNSITCLATDISASSCLYKWTENVSQSGTFTKDSSMNSWPEGRSGIPSGWTVKDYTEPIIIELT